MLTEAHFHLLTTHNGWLVNAAVITTRGAPQFPISKVGKLQAMKHKVGSHPPATKFWYSDDAVRYTL